MVYTAIIMEGFRLYVYIIFCIVTQYCLPKSGSFFPLFFNPTYQEGVAIQAMLYIFLIPP